MILVVGGAGSIGNHIVNLLAQTEQVIVYDNLSTGQREAVDERVIFIEGDIADEQRLTQVFTLFPIDAVVHVAAASIVGESVINPQHYYENNVGATLVLLKVMRIHGVKNIIFSSTAATYAPRDEMLHDQSYIEPINPYGRSKYFVERILEDYTTAYDMNCIVFRYFNVAGAQNSAQIGESLLPETHLIPLVLKHLNGEDSEITIHGEDFETSDGTCIRDFLHVVDLANAHVLALKALQMDQSAFTVYNLGNEQGYLVRDIIHMCEQITNKKGNIKISNRRLSNPANLIASSQKVQQQFDWHQNSKY